LPAAYSGDTALEMIVDLPPRAAPAAHEEAFRFLDAFYTATPAP
jgi:hypothetical protein